MSQVTLNDVYDALGRAFPGGIRNKPPAVWNSYHKQMVRERNDDVVRVGPYLIVPWNTFGQIELDWQMGPESRRHSDLHPLLDNCRIYTPDDLIGWVSYIRGRIEDLTYNIYGQCLNPADLFPQGDKTIQELQIVWQTLQACGVPLKTIIGKVAKWLMPHVHWKKGKHDTWAFLVNSAGEGIVGGRLNRGGALGTSTFEGRCRVPVSRGRAIDERLFRDYLAGMPPTNDDLKLELLWLYVENLFKYMKNVLAHHQPTWGKW